ncbi:MAG: hypothetical protein ACQEUZ_08470 [Pseudomonadota bacterium]
MRAADALAFVARNGRVVLIGGLVAGVALPGLAAALVPFILPLVGLMLFITTLRVGPAVFPEGPRGWRQEAVRAVLLQTALPLAALLILSAAGVADTPLGLATIITLAACPISGSAGLALMAGADPAPALRAAGVGTALFPLTVLPVLAALPGLGPAEQVLGAALRLLALIGLAGGGALLVRALVPALRRPTALPVLDGGLTLSMGVIVIALMAAVGPALRGAPGELLATLALALALGFGQQTLAFGAFLRLGEGPRAAALAVAAGNRNLALFFAALPEEVRGPLLLYLGLYQIPMYLTPLVMKPLYDRGPHARAG